MRKFASLVMFLCWLGPVIGQTPNAAGDARANAGGPVQNARATDTSLTVMTWNLEWFFDDQSGDNFSDLAKEKSTPDRAKWDWRRDAFADSIAAAQPTVLAVQEVENRRVLWYLGQSLGRRHQLQYDEFGLEGRDYFTEQDVGLMLRPPVELVSLLQHGYLKRLRDSNDFYDVSKHLMAELEFRQGDQVFPVLILNVHLRARPEAEPLRIRQTRLIHRWVRDAVRAGKDVIVLGDFNTEETGAETREQSELGVACGLETVDPDDDLIDLNLRLPSDMRQTHMLPGRQYDRVLCSRSLVDDDPSRPDLVFSKIEVLRELSVRGDADDPQQHWDGYWKLPEGDRDLSDHYPVMATFDVR